METREHGPEGGWSGRGASAMAGALDRRGLVATLYRYVLSGHAGRIRTCERWMVDAAMAEDDALAVAKEWGGKRALKVRLVYPVPVMPGALNEAAGAP